MNKSIEIIPFNFWVIKDIQTNLQVAFSHEQETIAEWEEDLSDELSTSTCAGFCMVAASALAICLEGAIREMGFQVQVYFNYLWADPAF